MNSTVARLAPEKLLASSLTSTFSPAAIQGASCPGRAPAYAFREQTASFLLPSHVCPARFLRVLAQLCPVCPVGSASMAFGQERVEQGHRAPLAERVVGVPAFG